MSETRGGGGGGGGHLDATGDREVVYCHQCHAEWYNDEHGLECPTCEGQITEIVTPGDSDPRPAPEPQNQVPPDFERIRQHNPWETTDSDPDEADIDEHITGIRGPHGGPRVAYFSRTIRSRGAGQDGPLGGDGEEHNPDAVMGDFHNMLTGMIGPAFQAGQSGRSGPDTLFTGGPFNSGGGNVQTFGGRTTSGHVMGARYTFTTNVTGGSAERREGQGDDVTAILGNIFGAIGGHLNRDPVNDQGAPPVGGMPPGLQSLFAALLNPANMRSGDAVYSQEALDQIISNLMDQHPQSNAPGPASPDAIASLPKKKVDEKMLGDDGKGECSVCMDDVQLGEEVVSLPCNHWFHETCVGLWLSEHNTCPICRKGIDSQPTQASDNQRASSSTSQNTSPWRDNRGPERPDRLSRSNTAGSRNEARLASIRRSGRLTPTQEDTPAAHPHARRWQAIGDPNSYSTGREHRPYDSRTRSSAASSPPLPRYSRHNSESSGRRHTSEQRSDRASRRRSVPFPSSSESSGGSSGPFAWLRSRWGDRSSREGR